MKKIAKLFVIFFMMMLVVFTFACQKQDQPNENTDEKTVETDPAVIVVPEEAKISEELKFASQTELLYAKNFNVYNYEDGYKLLTLKNDTKYLVVPEGKTAPSDLVDGITVVQLPIQNLLISSTPTTSLINAMGDLDKIKFTTQKESGWYIDAVVNNMKDGKLVYVGEYKAPDYELLAENKPTMSVFSTMLETVPEVVEKLKELNIPYMLDFASEEAHPLARVEYTKLYGALIGTSEENINKVFDDQVKYVDEISKVERTGKTAVIFYITSKGALYVRNAGDYVTKMLDLAGGDYINPELGPDKTGNTKMEFEEFFATCKDADFIIYIWSMGGKPENMTQFLEKSELLSEFKAVKENNVWCTTPDFFQIADTLGYMVADINKMLTSTEADEQFTYLFRLK